MRRQRPGVARRQVQAAGKTRCKPVRMRHHQEGSIGLTHQREHQLQHLVHAAPPRGREHDRGTWAVLIATGVSYRRLEARGADALGSRGVYYGASFGVLQSLFDVDQVAVLKGPQGTLFGRNTTGGAIRLITARRNLSSAVGCRPFSIGRRPASSAAS